jgi:hypothetical protein
MPVAAISSSLPAAVVRRAASSASLEAPDAVRGVPPVSRGQGPRHELVVALNQALGLQGAAAQDPATERAVADFAHALVQDLNVLAASQADGSPRPAAQEWNGLPQRLTTLATAASQHAGGGAAVQAAAPESPPNPLTTATAAVHIMKVPSSHVLEAFVALQRALGRQSDAAAAPADARGALAGLARRMADSLGNGGAGRAPAGAVLDLSA